MYCQNKYTLGGVSMDKNNKKRSKRTVDDEDKYVATREFGKKAMSTSLPKTEWDHVNNRPILNVDGIDDKDLDRTMKKFLGLGG